MLVGREVGVKGLIIDPGVPVGVGESTAGSVGGVTTASSLGAIESK